MLQTLLNMSLCFPNILNHLSNFSIWSSYLVKFLSVDSFICLKTEKSRRVQSSESRSVCVGHINVHVAANFYLHGNSHAARALISKITRRRINDNGGRHLHIAHDGGSNNDNKIGIPLMIISMHIKSCCAWISRPHFINSILSFDGGVHGGGVQLHPLCMQ
jgi:hypothetical protein